MRGRLFFASAAVLAAGACASAGADTGPSPSATTSSTKPKSATVVKVSLENFKFVGIPAVIDGPTVRFDAVNRGSVEHELEVLDSSGEALGEIEAMKTGKRGSLTLDLPPGDYTAQCLVKEGDKTHKELGMVENFEVS